MRICNFDGARRIGPPRQWDDQLDGDCLDIHVCDAVDTLSGINFMYSVFRLSPAEIEALMNGGAIRLGIAGHMHPVVNIGVLSPRICEQSNIREMGDLGPVLDLDER